MAKKKSDRRYTDDRGIVWASEYEFKIYSGLRARLGASLVTRCTTEEGHSFDYTSPVTRGYCLECGSGEVAQRRVYTPDMYVLSDHAIGGRYYIEAKGHFPPARRNLLSHFRKTGQDIDLLFILQNDSKATPKRTLSQWIASYMGCESFVWNPSAPVRDRKGNMKVPSPVDVPQDLFDFLTKGC